MNEKFTAPHDLTAVMWECKEDYADGWIRYFDEQEALAYQRDTGCAMRVFYRPYREPYS